MKRMSLILLCLGFLSTLAGCYAAPYPYDDAVSVGVGTSFYYSPTWKGHSHYYSYDPYYRPYYYNPYRHHHKHGHKRHGQYRYGHHRPGHRHKGHSGWHRGLAKPTLPQSGFYRGGYSGLHR